MSEAMKVAGTTLKLGSAEAERTDPQPVEVRGGPSSRQNTDGLGFLALFLVAELMWVAVLGYGLFALVSALC
jgi:hypothetical protein